MDRETSISKVKEQSKVYAKLLDDNLNSGKLLVTNDNHRQTGKTTALIEVSNKYRIPVIAAIGSHIPIYKEHYNCNLIYAPNDIINGEVIPPEALVNGVLIDEKISIEQLYKISNRVQIRTGFFYSDFLMPTVRAFNEDSFSCK